MNKYYILICPWAVYVKEAGFFVSQGGLTSKWGQAWVKVEAEGIEEARVIGVNRRDKKEPS